MPKHTSSSTTSVSQSRRSKRVRPNDPPSHSRDTETTVIASSTQETTLVNALSKTPFQAKPKSISECETTKQLTNDAIIDEVDKTSLLEKDQSITSVHKDIPEPKETVQDQPSISYEPVIASMIESCTCGICMDMMAFPVSLVCGHTYCFACYANWRQQSLECPSCRKKSQGFTPNLPLRQCITALVNSGHPNICQSDREAYGKRAKEGEEEFDEMTNCACHHHHNQRDHDDEDGYDNDGYYYSDNDVSDSEGWRYDDHMGLMFRAMFADGLADRFLSDDSSDSDTDTDADSDSSDSTSSDESQSQASHGPDDPIEIE